ncbi:MAG: MFS transporter [Chloroflexi bacterium]|nr:MFS transporter [Chloroflexota bacterium]
MRMTPGITIAAGEGSQLRAVAAGSAGRALLASFLGWLFDGYETYALVLVAGVAVPQLLTPAQAPQTSVYIGGLLAVTLFGWATGGLVAGVLADYLGRRRMLMASILTYAAFTGLTALAPTYLLLLVFRFLTGLGLGAEWAPGAALVGELWPPSHRGRAAAILQSALGFGFFFASALWLALSPLGPSAWRFMFLIGVLPALLVLAIRKGLADPELWAAAVERRQAARVRARDGRPLSAEDHALVRFTLTQLWMAPALRRRLLVLLAMSTSTLIAWWGVSTWIPLYAGQLAGRAGLGAQQWASLGGLVYNAGGIVGYVLFGILADGVGRKPTIFFYYLGSLPLVVALFLLVQQPALFLFVAAINGFFTLGQFSWLPVYLPELFPTSVRGSAIAIVFNTSRYVAGFGPLLAGVLIAQLGGIASAASIFGLFYVVGLVATPFAGPETRGQPLPE